MWAESGYNSSIPLSVTSVRANPGPTRVVAVTLLGTHVITPLYTFAPNDVDGVWNVTLGGLKGALVIPVHFVNPSAHQVSLAPLAFSLQGGTMSISTQARLGDSYDQEVCAAGNVTGRGVVLTPPPDMRNEGRVAVTPGGSLSVSALGQVNQSFSFWLQLLHPYSLDEPAANSLLISDLLTAQSPPVTFTAPGTVNTKLTLNMPLREGRYNLRAYFQNSSSLDVVQTRVLVMNDSSWISLSDSCPPESVQSSSISYPASLTNGESTWPRSLFVMYRTFGVEAVSTFPVKANLSGVEFSSLPWNVPLSGVTVNVPNSPGVVQTSISGSSLFVLTSRYPLELNYSLDISGGHRVAQGTVTLNQRYASQTSFLKLAKLTVHVLSEQSSPTVLQVTGPQGVSIASGLAGTNQTSSFILPGGSYTIAASQGGNSQSVQVSLTDGLATFVTINFNTFMTLEIILIVTAVMGGLANVAVWVLRSRSLSSRLAR